jgi:hypothetical protein
VIKCVRNKSVVGTSRCDVPARVQRAERHAGERLFFTNKTFSLCRGCLRASRRFNPIQNDARVADNYGWAITTKG